MKCIDFLKHTKELSWQSVGSWPSIFRGLLLTIIFLLLMFCGFRCFILPKQESLAQLKNISLSFRKQYQEKMIKTRTLAELEISLDVIKKRRAALLSALPQHKQLSALITLVTDKAQQSGLIYHHIRPLTSERKTFYEILPIQFSMEGDFHGFGQFFSRLGEMNRLMTLHDFQLSRQEGSDQLMLWLIAKMYWQKEES